MRLPWMRGYVEAACHLTTDILLIVGWCIVDGEDVRVDVHHQGRAIPTAARWARYSRPDVADQPHPTGMLIVAHLGGPPGGPIDRLAVHGPGFRCATRAASRPSGASDAAAIVGARLTWLDDGSRQRLMAFLLEAMSLESVDRTTLAHSLCAISAVLNPVAVGGVTATTAALETVLRTSETSVYLRGRLPANTKPRALIARSPEGHRIDILRDAYWACENTSSEPTATRFFAHATISSPSVLRAGWRLEIVDGDGAHVCVPGPAVTVDEVAVRRAVLDDLAYEHPSSCTLMETHVHPALGRLQGQPPPTVTTEVVDLGSVPASPEVSLVICLYRRLDLMPHQLVQFAADVGMRPAEVIYVLDSPELRHQLRDAAGDLHGLYRFPFRIVLPDHHLGYGAANNLGVSIARGRMVLLCNSDVFPAAPRWLTRLVEFHDATSNVGAVGPKLLYEDETLQHAGLFFDRPDGAAVWSNEHCYKGLERTLPAANVARKVPAVTGACFLIDRALYQQHGGFRSCFVEGDYEDSDLCLRLSAAGKDHWYCPGVELYHLEAQSYESERRAVTSRYNAWLHTRLWDDRIAATMRSFTA